MIPTLPQDIQNDLTQLAQRYGQPIVHTADLPITGLFDPLNATDRYGEVCMVVRRRNGKLLTMIKTFYPRGGYRLMTGGINFGENILNALLRETYEETGLTVNVTRFLAAVTYRAPRLSDNPLFYSFAFLLDELSGTLEPTDPHERVEAYREIAPAELPAVADFLEHIPTSYSDEFDGNWHEWGIFRAVIHHLAWQALQNAPNPNA
jgi:8-oxo-dGTP pyrophosphatase MutT (NUDIX family)